MANGRDYSRYVSPGSADMASALSVLAGSILRYYESKEDRALARERMGLEASLEKERIGVEKMRAGFERRRLSIEENAAREQRIMNAHTRMLDMFRLDQAREQLELEGKRVEIESRRADTEEKALGIQQGQLALQRDQFDESKRQFNVTTWANTQNFWSKRAADANAILTQSRQYLKDGQAEYTAWEDDFHKSFYKVDEGKLNKMRQAGATDYSFFDVAEPNKDSLPYKVWDSSDRLQGLYPTFDEFLSAWADKTFETVVMIEHAGDREEIKRLSTYYEDTGFQADLSGMFGRVTTEEDREIIAKAVLADMNPTKDILRKIKDRDFGIIGGKMSEGLNIRSEVGRLEATVLSDHMHYRAANATYAAVANKMPEVDPTKNEYGVHDYYNAQISMQKEEAYVTGPIRHATKLDRLLWTYEGPEVVREKARELHAKSVQERDTTPIKQEEVPRHSEREFERVFGGIRTQERMKTVEPGGDEAAWALIYEPEKERGFWEDAAKLYKKHRGVLPSGMEAYRSYWDMLTEVNEMGPYEEEQ